MALFEIEGPDGQVYEVEAPDMDSAARAFSEYTPSNTSEQPQTGYADQGFSGILEGLTGTLGAPVDILNNLVVAPALGGINSLLGTDLQPSKEPLGGSAGLRRGLAISPPSDNTGHQMFRRTMQSTGGAAVPAIGAGGTAAQVAAALLTGTGGGAAASISQQLFPDNIGAEIAAELLGSVATGGVVTGLADRAARKQAEAAVPSIDNLKAEASALYDKAEARGVVATPAMTKTLADDITDIARSEELITPTGRVAEAYPKAREALNLMKDYSGFDMNPTQMQVIRDTLSDAAFNSDGKEGRIARKMLSKFDEFVSPLAPEIDQARAVSQRYLQAQKLAKMEDLAGARAGQFTGSGYENALRTEYRNLDRRIIKGQERGWSPEQVRAIQDVSRGTPMQNTARNLGRLAPTGVVSGGMTAGVPFMIGNTMGGPGVGALAAGTTMGTGFAARDVATRMGIRNAEIADLLTRSGGNIPNATNPAIREAVIQALLGSHLAAQSGAN